MQNSPDHRLSRREFLKLTGAAVLSGLPLEWAGGGGPDVKIVDGVQVWGAERPVTDPNDVERIGVMYEKGVLSGRMLKRGTTKAEVSRVRKEVLPASKIRRGILMQ